VIRARRGAATATPRRVGGRRARGVALCARRLIETATQRVVLSTDDVPVAERFGYWREAVCERMWGISGERNKDQETPFNGRIIASVSGPLRHIRSRADSYPLFRRPRDIARRSMDNMVLVYREHSVVRWFGHSEFHVCLRLAGIAYGTNDETTSEP
jgi:hypothetical protein